MTQTTFVPLTGYQRYPEAEIKRRAGQFYASRRERRTVRHFSERRTPPQVVGTGNRGTSSS